MINCRRQVAEEDICQYLKNVIKNSIFELTFWIEKNIKKIPQSLTCQKKTSDIWQWQVNLTSKVYTFFNRSFVWIVKIRDILELFRVNTEQVLPIFILQKGMILEKMRHTHSLHRSQPHFISTWHFKKDPKMISRIIGNVQTLIDFMTVFYTRWRFDNYLHKISLLKKFVKLCLHLSNIVQNSFHFDEIFHIKFKLSNFRFVC